MDKTIKTRDIVKDIKVFDKKAAMTGAVHNAHTKTKDVAEKGGDDTTQYLHGNDYAESKTEQAAQSGAEATGRKIVDGAKKSHETVRDIQSKVKDAKQTTQQVSNTTRQQTAQAASKRATQKTVSNTATKTAVANKQAAANSANVAKGSIKQGAKGTVKASTKSIKTASATAKTTVKTSRQAAQGAKAAAKGTQVAARNAANAARAAAKVSAAAIKAAARGIAAFAKMAIAAVKSLVSAIAAGGWVAVAVILIICLVGLIATSAFGIFFAGGDMGDGNPALREVIAQVNQEHQTKVDEVKATTTHDDVIMSGTKAPWREVLAIYSVRATTSADDPFDVITLDERRQQMLREVFWDMNKIESRTEQRESYSVTLVEETDGTLTEETEVVTVTTLYITFTALSADEAADLYHFTAAQKNMLHELLDTKNESLWQAVLYGIHNGSGDIVEVAASQIGNVGGQPYWSWYGFGGRVEWCACFVSWCANECGYIEADIIPKFAGCEWQGEAWFKARGQWQELGYVPQPGDIIFFDWDGGGSAGVSDHVGIVESCDGTTIHTIEGNSGDAVRRSSYSVNSTSIAGFGIPSYR